ncbi:HAMP domain protein [Sphingomonas sp. S17]|uniref:histidine kinase n=2 Tax=Sphingomonas paucimobilis TaxID=13689 RepID=A0A411LLD6_SPHPI|nr:MULTISPECIES: HAMP domain-containing sensor histidine kinase [Sphingomonas]EGI55559.1 HAMP domain protein [Sphingomonas sp. S17]MBQ1481890.1 HAMP domain-containing histidine kinase [Sphingomonas sp.]MCM3680180.1 HAMP domain-containing histidine kinase [Sphingomonas paucimobilis]MDG5970371.1 HAMP domain-containing histidine kinase [Sphingomonas paucimobilis]NNG56328.1 HAMP domain-containing histidine kinase [Sphingomonas paucimobilis]
MIDAAVRRVSLRGLTAGVLLLFLVATVATGVSILAANRVTVAQLVDRRIDVVGDLLLERDGDGGTAPIPTRTLLARIVGLSAQRDTGDVGLLLLDPAGRALGGNIRLRHDLPLGRSDLRARDGIVGLSHGRALVRDAGAGRRLVIVAETEPFDDYRTQRTRIYLIGFGSIILIVLGGVIAFSRLVGRRIGDLRRAVDAIIAGDIRHRVPLTGSADEFDRQAAAFNRMLDRIAELMEGMRGVSNDIAHDLRTPLSRLRGQLAGMVEEADGPEQATRARDALAQCDALLAMFAALLRIAEVEAGHRQAGFAPIDLAALVEETATMMMPVAEEAGHRLHLRLAVHPKNFLGDRQLLIQALVNLIGNAIKHGAPGGRIQVTLEAADGDRLALRVADDGPGISPEDRALALRRFGRLDSARTRAGHGLGLPLVAAIARLHRGELELGDARPGLAVSMLLPLPR